MSFMVTPRALGQVICGHCLPSAASPNCAAQDSGFVMVSDGHGITRPLP